MRACNILGLVRYMKGRRAWQEPEVVMHTMLLHTDVRICHVAKVRADYRTREGFRQGLFETVCLVFVFSLFFFFSFLFENREMVQNMVSTPIWGTGNPYWSHIFIVCIMRMQRYKVAALSLPSTKQQPKYYLKHVNSLHKMNQLTDLFLVFCVPLMSNRHSTVEEVQEG